MTDQGAVELVVFIAAVLGTLAGTLYPYWAKLRENPEMGFEKKFVGTAVISFIASIAISIGLFSMLVEAAQQIANTGSLASVFAITATSAFGIARASNMLMPSREKAVETETSTTTTTVTAAQPSLPPPPASSST